MTDQQTSELGKAIQEVSEKASLLVREEIALAKAELSEKVSGLAKGAAVGAAAGVFILAGLIYFLHFLALLIADVLGSDTWLGYLIVAGVLFLLGGLAGFMAARFFKKGTPPTPQMAIEEAQLIKKTITAPHPATSTAVAPAAPSKVEAR
jgi:putative superfamily III holin-X